MKQKYTISRNKETNKLIIREYAELEKEILTLLCEQTYDDGIIKTAAADGKATLVPALRNHHMYPINSYMEKIAESVMNLYNPKKNQSDDLSEELLFDDIEYLIKEMSSDTTDDSIEGETSEIDGLLDEDVENVFDEKDEIKKLDSSLKMSGDDSMNDGEDA